ncbi:MAG: hypothetical protein ACOYXR_05715 [Nitrospirota bacterium]
MKKIRVKKRRRWIEQAVLWSLITAVGAIIMLGVFYFGDNRGGHMSTTDTETERASPGEPQEESMDTVSSGVGDHDPRAHNAH